VSVTEHAYHEGFIDGQEGIIEEIQEIIDTWNTPHSDDMALTISMIKDLLDNKKQEIESL
jgi:hypothetical protein